MVTVTDLTGPSPNAMQCRIGQLSVFVGIAGIFAVDSIRIVRFGFITFVFGMVIWVLCTRIEK